MLAVLRIFRDCSASSRDFGGFYEDAELPDSPSSTDFSGFVGDVRSSGGEDTPGGSNGERIDEKFLRTFAKTSEKCRVAQSGTAEPIPHAVEIDQFR